MNFWKKIISRTLCFQHQGFFRSNYIFNNDAYFLDFRAQKIPLIFFNVKHFKHQQALHFGILNYEKQHKEGTCKVSGRSVVFSAFYADFCLCPKLVIITTLSLERKDFRKQYNTDTRLFLKVSHLYHVIFMLLINYS